MSFFTLSSSPKKSVFEIHNIDVSIVNGLRRCILSEIVNVAPHYNPYNAQDNDIQFIVNKTSLHNEIMGHRISLIPIMMDYDTIQNYQPDMFSFEIHVKNTTVSSIWVTSKDIVVYDQQGHKLSNADRDKMFPCDPITKDWIIITKLKPNLKDPQNGQELHVRYKCRPGIAKQDAKWAVVSLCSFYNKVDEQVAQKGYSEALEIAKKEKQRSLTLEEKRSFDNYFENIEKKRCFYKNERNEPSAFVFTIESECLLNPETIMQSAFDILIQKVQCFKDSELDMMTENGMVWLNIENEDHTLGYLIQALVFNNYVLRGKSCNYIGYHMPHPLEERVVLKIRLDQYVELKEFLTEALTLILTHLKSLKTAFIASIEE